VWEKWFEARIVQWVQYPYHNPSSEPLLPHSPVSRRHPHPWVDCRICHAPLSPSLALSLSLAGSLPRPRLACSHTYQCESPWKEERPRHGPHKVHGPSGGGACGGHHHGIMRPGASGHTSLMGESDGSSRSRLKQLKDLASSHRMVSHQGGSPWHGAPSET
jgi:hypothetical protein